MKLPQSKFKEGLNWYGWTTPFSGYGIVTLEYILALDRLTDGRVSVGWQRRQPGMDQEWNALSEQQQYLIYDKPFNRERIGIIKTTPELFKYNESEIKIAYTMVENTRVGQNWIDTINGMSALFVPSKYLIDVFKESGCKVPIFNVKQGINPVKYKYFKRQKKNKFVFGTCGWLDDRKSWKELVTAFTSEFDPEEPVELWLKNSNNTFGYELPADPRVLYIDQLYTFDQMIEFYHQLDCLVFPSKAEGAGMPPREAMATGLPVILTNWSGLADIADSKYNYPINPIAIDADDYRMDRSQPGKQARIDIAELMYWMRYVYDNWEEAMLKGKQASEWMHTEWTWNECAKDMLNILKENFGYE